MDSTLREAYEPRVWDSNPSPACAKPVSVDPLFPSAGKWFLEAETRPSQAAPRGRHFGLSGRAFSLPAGNPPEMTAIFRRSGCASNSGRWLVADAVPPNRSPRPNSACAGAPHALPHLAASRTRRGADCSSFCRTRCYQLCSISFR